MTDFRALCAELLSELKNAIRVIHCEDGTRHISSADPVIAKVDAALSQPEPEGPTDEELRELWQESWDTSEEHGAFQFARAVLARWGRPTPQPSDNEVTELVAWLRELGAKKGGCFDVSTFCANLALAADLLERLSPPQPIPVSERLPGPGDCDAEGRCWWLTLDWEGPVLWDQSSTPTHWLPAHALPLPADV